MLDFLIILVTTLIILTAIGYILNKLLVNEGFKIKQFLTITFAQGFVITILFYLM
ncbi:hypothetical protein [Bacillus alkalisoli]|uniref:hypothetical protein n=1 Tax=Bacillus alkalisoli TaxID=2011008 RepID=UPI0012FF201D|nr:hypothetical protein [Bacillus alkalisoli]